MNLKIRKINADEVEKLTELYIDDDNDTFMDKRRANINNHIIDIYVIEDSKKIIGEVTIVYNDKHKDFTVVNQRVYMEALRILEQYQGKGIGQYFLEKVIKQVKEQGIKEIIIGVEDDNVIAKHIYSKLGFNEFMRREAGDKYALDGFDVFLKRL